MLKNTSNSYHPDRLISYYSIDKEHAVLFLPSPPRLSVFSLSVMAAVATFISLSSLRSPSSFELRDLPRNPNPSIRRRIHLKSPAVAASSKNSSPQNIQNIVESPEPDPDPKPEHG